MTTGEPVCCGVYWLAGDELSEGPGGRRAFRADEGTSLPLPRRRGMTDGRPISMASGRSISVERFWRAGQGARDRAHRFRDAGDGRIRRDPDHRGISGTGFRAAGEKINMIPDPAMVHLFDAETGRRMFG